MILGFKIGFLEVRWIDVLDILFVAVLLYQLYKLLKGSVAVRVLTGFLFLYLIYLIVRAAEMNMLAGILGQFMGVGVLAAIIIFSQEIRKFLLLLGKTTFRQNDFVQSLMIWKKKEGKEIMNLSPILEALRQLASSSTGALIVFSRNSELKFYADSGDLLDAFVSKRLLLSIFNKSSPLHDGAIIIFNDKIVAARCILPVSERDIPAQFGMRHRAALGMSEATDTLVVTISEETGQMSIARNGVLDDNIPITEIRRRINSYLQETEKVRNTNSKESPEGLEVAS